MKKTIFVIGFSSLYLFISCQNLEIDNIKRTRFFKTYMKEYFPEFRIKDGEYLFVLPGGCFNCNKAVFQTLYTLLAVSPDSNYIDQRYQAILISKNNLEIFSNQVLKLHKNVLCDITNKLDRMSFGIYGISVLKIENGQIVASKNFTVKDYETGSENFFKEPL